MKKTIAALSAALILSTAIPAHAAGYVTVTNLKKISTKDKTVLLSVKGLPKDRGIYISQCMAIEAGQSAPTACNTAEASKLWVSNNPADQKMGAKAPSAKLSIKIDKYFDKGDCIHTKCIIYVTNDHKSPADPANNQAISFKFSGINLF